MVSGGVTGDTSSGAVIDGRFELRGRLGSGGMGTVWRALDLALQREVALKEVRLAGTDGGEREPRMARMLRERVMREAQALARIDHPNVVTIHHIVDSAEMTHPWLVMELVRGQSLQDRLERGPMRPAEAAALGRGILAALRAAHAAGIQHRDVKPANVLLREDGTPVLTDFGIAVLDELSRVTATGGLVGSPEYIAPERLHGHEGNPASDLWSLGLLLYVAVEGDNPLRRPTTAATLAAVLTAEIPPSRYAGPLAPVLQALLMRDPNARPATERLDQMLAQVEGGSTPPTPPPPAYSPSPPAPGTNPGWAPGPGTHPGWGPGPMPGTSPGAAPPLRRRGSAAALPLSLIGIMVVAVIGAIIASVVLFVPKLLDAAGKAVEGAVPTEGPDLGGAAGESPDAGGSNGGGEGGDFETFLTPAAIRFAIKKFKEASGSKKFAQLTFYEERASADAPVRGRRGAFDNYTYELGADAAARSRPSVAITTGNAMVDPSTFKWDALPSLLRRAERTLKVPRPTLRYILVRAAWAFSNDAPVMMIYFTDEYDAGYLSVNQKGQVISTSPADS